MPKESQPSKDPTGDSLETPPVDDAGTTVSASVDTAQGDTDEDLPEYEPLTPELVKDEAIRGDFMLRWVIVLLAFLMASTRIAETPTLVHVKSGQYMAAHGILPPSTDVFSYTASERSWINLSWLFDLLLAGCHAVGGGIGLTILKATLVAGAFWFVVNIGAGRTSTWGSSVCAAIALLACHTSLAAQPEVVTLLGLGITCWILHTWKEGGPERRIWALVPLFLLWSNLDPRMFLGLVALLLYGVGDLLGGLLNRSSLTTVQRKKFQTVVGVSFLVSLVNPFGWHALLSPIRIYGSEYPAFREFLIGIPTNIVTVRYYTLAHEGVWRSLGHSGIAAVAMFVVATVMLILNHRRLDLGHALMYFGFSAFAFAGVEQLPAAAIIFSVLAALNGQAWYQAKFSQEYTVKTSELMFSRGGRVLTVLAFSGMAIMAGFGWLRPPQGGTTGFGFDYMLQEALDGLKEQSEKTYSDRAYNFFAHQGDMLIWVGQKPFLDGRLGLYYGTGEDNLLVLHKKVRQSLRIQHQGMLGAPPKKDQAVDVQPDDWKAVFDKYQITHAFPRLTTKPFPDYPTLMAFLLSSQDWRLTDLSGAAALFHRVDQDDKELMKFVLENEYNFIDTAFRQESQAVEPRADWVKPPDYQQELWAVKKQIPEQIQRARHLNVMLRELYSLSNRFPLRDRAIFPAMAYLAIRNAQQGLDEDPSSTEGYVELGNAYYFLAAWNQGTLMSRPNWQGQGFRFFQSLYAYNQALVADPNHPIAHTRLFEFYNSPGFFRLDLALRELDALDKMLKSKTNLSKSEQQRQDQVNTLRSKMQEQLDQVHQKINEALERGATPLQLANLAFRQYKCPLEALQRLDNNPTEVAGNPAAQLLRLSLLLEAGRIQDAYELAVQLEQQFTEGGPQGWRMIVSVVLLANAEYEKAQELWEAEQTQIEAAALAGVLNGLPPRFLENSRTPWPASMTSAAFGYLVNRSNQLSSLNIDMAFSYLESGNVKAAAEKFRESLEQQPNSMARGMVVFYLSRITGEYFDPVAPADRVPVIFADGPEMKSADDTVKPDADKATPPTPADEKK